MCLLEKFKCAVISALFARFFQHIFLNVLPICLFVNCNVLNSFSHINFVSNFHLQA